MASRVAMLCGLALAAAGFAAGATVEVIAHRGEHLHHPENTIAAYEAAIACGADYIEVDVRTTRDGKLVVMHDGKVDRTTNGTGLVKEMTLEQIRALDAGMKFSPEFAGTKVPEFDQVVEMARGRIQIYVDTKSASAADVAAALERQGMLEKAVIYGGFQYLRDFHALRPRARMMPESVSVPVLTKLIADLQPPVVAFSEEDWKDEIIALAKKSGAAIFVDRLGDADDEEHWKDAIARGATGIQTNKPEELVKYLRSVGMHR